MIKVEGLTKFYGQFCAVNQISFEINKGEIIGLLGPNGAGKSTTLRMLTSFYKPSAGKIWINDMSANENPEFVREMIGYLPESAPLYHDMLVYDYLSYICDVRGIKNKQKRIQELCDLCKLGSIMHLSINELSKGLRQRVGLAHAMAADPKILILDEPTSGLDPNQIIEIREMIKKMGSQKTVILSSHILSEVEATCDRVIIINKGIIVADSPIKELKNSLDSESIVELILRNAKPEQVQKVFENFQKIEIHPLDDNEVSVKIINSGKEDIRSKIYQLVKKEDWILLQMTRDVKSLENIFIELTKEA